MDESYYKKYEPIFGSWYIKELIGEGSYGQVYEIERTEFDKTYKSALKTISVPHSKNEIKSLMSEGMSLSEATGYYEGVVKTIVDECKLMSDLKGISNIVSYEDHMVIPHNDGIGYDILIRMELLTPILEYTYQQNLSENEIIKLGIDMCKALEVCEINSIVHRDIKLENIFASAIGDYKLGDFGIARTLEKTAGGLSKKGTTAYMAPEVYKGEEYGPKVDIYSLGIVLYRLLNNGRIPFLPPFPEPITYDAKEMAIIRRIKGDAIPPINNVNPKLSEAVLKACAYNPDDRFERAGDFRKALEECVVECESVAFDDNMLEKDSITDSSEKTEILADTLDDNTVILNEDDATIVASLQTVEETTDNRAEREPIQGKEVLHKDETEKEKVLKKPIAVLFTVALLIVAAVFVLLPKPVENITGIQDTVKIVLGESLAPEYEVVQKGLIRSGISFSMENEKIASVDEDGVIHAEKIGKTKLILKAGSYEKTVNIKVASKVSEIENVSDISIYVGDSYELKPVLKPEKYSDEKISYSVEDKSVASVDKNGKVNGKQAGQTTIKISAGGCIRKILVSVNQISVAPQKRSKSNDDKELEELWDYYWDMMEEDEEEEW